MADRFVDGSQPSNETWEPEESPAEDWRGDLHPEPTNIEFEDWPEYLAGAEYWLYKKEL